MGKNKKKGGKKNEGEQGVAGGEQSSSGSQPASAPQPQQQSTGGGNAPQRQPRGAGDGPQQPGDQSAQGRGMGRQAYRNEPEQVEQARPGEQSVAGLGRGGRGQPKKNWKTSAPVTQPGVQMPIQPQPFVQQMPGQSPFSGQVPGQPPFGGQIPGQPQFGGQIPGQPQFGGQMPAQPPPFGRQMPGQPQPSGWQQGPPRMQVHSQQVPPGIQMYSQQAPPGMQMHHQQLPPGMQAPGQQPTVRSAWGKPAPVQMPQQSQQMHQQHHQMHQTPHQMQQQPHQMHQTPHQMQQQPHQMHQQPHQMQQSSQKQEFPAVQQRVQSSQQQVGQPPQQQVGLPPQQQQHGKSAQQQQTGQPAQQQQTGQPAQQQGQKKKGPKQQGQPQKAPDKDQSLEKQTPAGPSKTRTSPDMPKETQDLKKLTIESDSGDTVGKEIEIHKKLSKGGKQGRPINLYANHFELKLGKVQKAYHYDFLITPDTPKKMLRSVFELVKRDHFPNSKPAFDGRKNMYSPYELSFGTEELLATVTVMEGERGKEFKVRVKKVNEINLGEIANFVSGLRNNEIHRQPMNAIQVLDVVLRHTQSSQKITVGSSFFTVPTGPIIDLGGGMEMYRGSYQSVQLGWKPFLNIDISNKAFPKALNIIDLIYELFPRVEMNQPLKSFQKEALSKYLKTMKVEYCLPNNAASKRRYGVNEVQDPARNIKFRRDPNSPEMTVEEYYRREKNLNLKYPNMPCLWVGSRTSQIKVRVPVEFCKLLEGQTVKRKLDGQQTTAMIRQCATSTDIRKKGIEDAIKSANFASDPIVREFDLQVDSNFAKLTGRILTPPNLVYENDRVVRVSKGVWNAEKFFNAANLLEWIVLCLDSYIRPGDIDNLCQKIQVCGKRLGMNIGPTRPPKRMDRLAPGTRGLDELKNYFKEVKGKFNIIFVIIKDKDYQYNYVKEASEIGVGCLTQCLKSFTVQRKINDATITNILLKVNAKLSGTNHYLHERPLVMKVPTMIMGADVTHPSPDSTDIPSVAAVTASHDPKAFKYNICWRLQPPGQEIITDLKEITKEHLMFFYKQNRQCKPANIIFYRDGVSNGQFLQVLRNELTAIRAACSDLDPTYKPNITFLVVQKRHNTRLFPADKRDSQDRNNNVPAGTCVDTLITDAVVQNFFLVSHASIQGVAKPTKYVNLWDDHNFSDDELESLTFYLCHMFARCTRSVSYPAPTYYAHLAAARAKVYCETRQINISRLPSEQERLTIKEEIIKGLPMFFI